MSKKNGNGEKDPLSEKAKKVIINSLEAVLFTQENILRILKELKLPKEVINTLLQQFEKNKEEFIQALANQFGAVLREVDITKLMKKLISGLTVKVNAEVTLTYKFDEKDEKAIEEPKKKKRKKR